MRYCVVTKGAPEVMLPLLSSAPASLVSEYKRHAAQGARVLALAYKMLPEGTSLADARVLSREEAESHLQLAGLALFQTPLKQESEPALRELAESGHPLVMITGDAALTACHVAKKVHITCREVLILTERQDGPALGTGVPSQGNLSDSALSADKPHAGGRYSWLSADESVQIPLESASWQAAASQFAQLSQQYDLCLTGDTLSYLTSLGGEPLLRAAIPLVQVSSGGWCPCICARKPL